MMSTDDTDRCTALKSTLSGFRSLRRSCNGNLLASLEAASMRCSIHLINSIKYATGDVMDSRAWGGHKLSNRSEEHTSELQSLMRLYYAGFRLKKKKEQTKV